MNTLLFIENTEIELTDKVQFALTKQYEELTNPTLLISDWSKTVNIPGTARNNQFFGHIYNPNMAISASTNTPTFINFDPTKKLNFRLLYNDNVLMTGYAKITEIKHSNNQITYSCNLNGQLGKIFQDIAKIRFDKTSDTSTVDDLDYIIDTSQFFRLPVNVSTMYDFFNNAQQHYYVYDSSGNINASLLSTDIVGFTPNLAYTDDFEYDTFQSGNSTSNSFSDALTNHQPSMTNMISADTIYPDGLKPREIGEFRTYQQLPYVYINKLFQIVQKKAEDLTGYSFDLDLTWFGKQNPYWYDTVMMLLPLAFNEDEKTLKNNTYDSYGLAFVQTDFTTDRVQALSAANYYSYKEDVPIANWGTQSATTFNTIADYTESCNFNLDMYMWMGAKVKSSTQNTYYEHAEFEMGAGLDISIAALDASGNVIESKNIIVCHTTPLYIDTTQYDQHVCIDLFTFTLTGNYGMYTMSFNIPFSFSATLDRYGNNWRCQMTMKWVNLGGYDTPLRWFDGDSPQSMAYYTPLNWNNTGPLQIAIGNDHKSFSNITLSSLWNFNYTPWEILLNYCKMFRLMIITDDINKKLKFIPSIFYFQDYSIKDWTSKLDMTKDFIIKPIYWDSHNVLFNTEDSETKLGQLYKEKFGFNYGEKNIITDYNFDTNTNSLFSNIQTSLNVTPSLLSWSTTYTDGKIYYVQPQKEVYVCSYDDDNQLINPFGQFFFYYGNMAFNQESSSQLRPCILSDDTGFQSANSKYFYTQYGSSSNIRSITGYQCLSLIKRRNLMSFEKPQQIYAKISLDDRNGIYYNFWTKFINERYNIQSKQVTCYIDLKPLDYLNFKWNNFVTIDNQLYFVNKIYDYDITTSNTTKVDLITINNVENYTTDNYQYLDGHIVVNQTDVGEVTDIEPGQTQLIRIKTNNDGEWDIEYQSTDFTLSQSTGTGNAEIDITCSESATAGVSKNVVIYRSDSPMTSFSDKESVTLTFNII